MNAITVYTLQEQIDELNRQLRLINQKLLALSCDADDMEDPEWKPSVGSAASS